MPILKRCYTFALVKQLAMTYQTTIAQQRNFDLFAFFSALYLAVSDILLRHTSNNGLSLCTKAIAVRPARVSVRRFKHLQGAFKALCRCFFVCVGQRMEQENV